MRRLMHIYYTADATATAAAGPLLMGPLMGPDRTVGMFDANWSSCPRRRSWYTSASTEPKARMLIVPPITRSTCFHQQIHATLD